MFLWQDLRFGGRMLVRNRWFTLAAMMALALGIAVNNTVFTLVNAVLLRPIPFPNPERIVSLGTRDDRNRDLGVSIRDLDDWRKTSRSFSDIAICGPLLVSFSDDQGAPEQYQGAYVGANFFRLLGQQPVLGRDFRDEDDRLSSPPTVILGGGVWKARYGGDPAILGRTVKGSNMVLTVIGVMPEGMKFPFNVDMWIPFAHMAPAYRIDRREARNYMGFGRLKDGVSITQARAELVTIGAGMAQQYVDTNKGMVPAVMTFNERVTGGPIRTIFLSLMGAVIFVLLIACANVANLLLARSTDRVKEIGVRISLGASRWRIVRQLLVESVLLSVVSGVLGFGLSMIGIRWFEAATSDIGIPYWMRFTIDARVFLFFAAVCLGTGILFGLAPALHVSKVDVNHALKEGGGRSAAGGVRARRWTSALVVVELALTIVLLAGAGLMMRSFLKLYTMDLGVNTSNLITFRFALPDRRYPSPEMRDTFFRTLDERLHNVPNIQASAFATTLPLGGGQPRELLIEGQAPSATPQPAVTTMIVGARYFATLGVRLLHGRPFDDLDGMVGHETAIVNQRLATMYFGTGDPIGRRIRLTARQAATVPSGMRAETWVTIVAIAPTIRQSNFQEPLPDPVVYLPVRAEPFRQAVLIVRTPTDAASVTPLVRDEVRAIDRDLPVSGIQTMDQWLAQVRWASRVFGTMFGVFALIALMLAAIGLYAVTAYSVTQRTPEIGVRLALGAQPRQIWWLIARRAVVQLAVGLLIGLAGAVGVGKVLQSFLIQTSSTDPMTLTATATVLAVVAIAACLWPTRRAMRIHPAEALRYE